MFKFFVTLALAGLLFTFSFGSSSAAAQKNKVVITTEDSCHASRFEKSQQIIRKILEDLALNYDHVGGEITNIQLISSNIYQVSISQEERIDQLTYHAKIGNSCEVKINTKRASVHVPREE